MNNTSWFHLVTCSKHLSNCDVFTIHVWQILYMYHWRNLIKVWFWVSFLDFPYISITREGNGINNRMRDPAVAKNGFSVSLLYVCHKRRLILVIRSVTDVLRAQSRFVKFVGDEAAGRTPYTFYKPSLGPKHVSNIHHNEFITPTTFI